MTPLRDSLKYIAPGLVICGALLVAPVHGASPQGVPGPAEASARGATFRFVGEESVYFALGIRSGDTVVSVDGIAPRSAAEASQLIATRHGDGKNHTMQVRRGGKTVTIGFR